MFLYGWRSKLKDHLEWAEGRRQFPYEDTVGKTSIGVGRNLDDRGLRDDEIDLMLDNDIHEATEQASTLPYYRSLNGPRRMVVSDMIFNMGLSRFLSFIKTNRALSAHDYDAAADEMVDSKWYRQTGRRAALLVLIMRTGEYIV